jgi:hypothetical protein
MLLPLAAIAALKGDFLTTLGLHRLGRPFREGMGRH